MAYHNSAVNLANDALQSTTRAAAMMRKSQQGNLVVDGIDAAIADSIEKASRFQILAATGLYQEGVIATVTQAAAPTFATPLLWTRTQPVFDYYGSAPGTVNGSFTGATVGNGRQFKVEFETDSEDVAFKLIGVNSNYDLFIDGVRATETSVVLTADSLNYVYEIKLAGRKFRHFSLAGFNTAFGGVWTHQARTVRLPTVVKPYAWQLGDSYTHGVGGTQAAFNDFRNVCDYFGFNGLGNGIGGSGWNSAGGQVPTSRVNSELKVLSHKPDYVFLSLGYNDAGGNMTNLKASMRSTIAAVRAIVPKAKLFGIGCATPLGGTPNLALVQAALKEVYTAEGIPFIDVYDVVNATNSRIYTISDNVHASNAGFRARARAMVEQLRQYL